MFGFLRQSTASQTRLIGPYLDDTDFKTPETALTIANTNLKISKNGAASANKNSGGGTHREQGMYSITLDATDTSEVGELCVVSLMTGAALVIAKFWVLEEAIYDALYASGAAAFALTTQRVGVGSWNGTTVGALNDITSANVLTQVNAALDTAIPELTQAVPSATPSIRAALALLGMMARNGVTVDTNGTPELTITNDAGTVVFKKILSDSGGIYTEAEMTAGP